MDYSLLLAVGFEVSPDGEAPSAVSAGEGSDKINASSENDATKWQSAWSTDLGGVRGMNGDFTERAEIYYMGVIDILQVSKAGE